MYNYTWTDKNGIFKLGISGDTDKELRPVYKEELDFFGFNEYWTYPDTDKPLLWAENIRRYVINGQLVAEAVGGGFYTKPTIKYHLKNIELSPIDVGTLWDVNADLMMGLMQTAILFIRRNHEKFTKQSYHSVCAFSGGKDSLVLLDLMSKALSPDQFYVIFGNTGMELSTTYVAVEKAKERYANLRFYEAKSYMPPEKSWDEFGPPGRRMRWCCSVHKSVPTVLKIREIADDYNARALVFDGIRAEESAQRAEYDDVSIGAKNTNQVNCSPIFKWNSTEVFLHLIANDLLLNQAYRQGLYRVGCMICPMSSEWWDGISNDLYKDELKPLLDKVERYAANTKPKKEVAKFVESGGWKARMGGKGLETGGNRITEVVENDSITFMLTQMSQPWNAVANILEPVENFV